MSKKSKNKRSRSEKILSVNISNLSEREILKVIDARIKKRKRTVIYTPNTQILLSADRSRAETALLNSASINIPDGAGLGGGSSNAAEVIRFLNDYWNLKLSKKEILLWYSI